MKFRHLEVFYAVMTNGTVTAAAHQLGVSQPSVTMTLQQAEASLGLQLFQREGGRLIPTDEARILFEEAERAHDALAALAITARGLKLSAGGHVRIAVAPSLAVDLLPDAIAAFEDKHTGFHYSVRTLNSVDIIDRLDLRDGGFDLGFTLGALEDASLAYTRIGDAQIYAVLPADWDVADAPQIELAELADRPYIGGFDNSALGLECRRLFTESGVEPDTLARSHAHSVTGALVERGLGYALLDSLTVRSLLGGPGRDRVAVREVGGAGALPVVAIYPSHRKLGHAAAIFIECFQQAFDHLAGWAAGGRNVQLIKT